jgi:hypothetical protein
MRQQNGSREASITRKSDNKTQHLLILASLIVQGEYCLWINDRLILGEIAPGASDKIRVDLFFVEPPPQPFGGAHNEPGVPSNEVFQLHVRHPPSLFSTLQIPDENAKLDLPVGYTQ